MDLVKSGGQNDLQKCNLLHEIEMKCMRILLQMTDKITEHQNNHYLFKQIHIFLQFASKISCL